MTLLLKEEDNNTDQRRDKEKEKNHINAYNGYCKQLNLNT